MKSIFALALVIVIALSAHQVLGQVCTAETCPETTSVVQTFRTPNCTGPSKLLAFVHYNVTCTNYPGSGGFSSSRRDSCSNGAHHTAYYSRANCAGTQSALDSIPTGVCDRASEFTSQIYWCNAQSVQPTFKPVKAPQNTTDLEGNYRCNPNVTTGCDDNTGTLFVFNEPGCKGTNISLVARPSVFFGHEGAATIGTCYVDNITDWSYDSRRNYLASCENGRYTYKTFTGGCGSSANLLLSESVVTNQCIQISDMQYALIKCSSASALAAVPLAIFLLLAILFL